MFLTLIHAGFIYNQVLSFGKTFSNMPALTFCFKYEFTSADASLLKVAQFEKTRSNLKYRRMEIQIDDGEENFAINLLVKGFSKVGRNFSFPTTTRHLKKQSCNASKLAARLPCVKQMCFADTQNSSWLQFQLYHSNCINGAARDSKEIGQLGLVQAGMFSQFFALKIPTSVVKPLQDFILFDKHLEIEDMRKWGNGVM